MTDKNKLPEIETLKRMLDENAPKFPGLEDEVRRIIDEVVAIEPTQVLIAKMELEPGDIVIVRANRFLDDQEVANLGAMMRSCLPEENPSWLIQPDTEIIVMKEKRSKGVVLPQ